MNSVLKLHVSLFFILSLSLSLIGCKEEFTLSAPGLGTLSSEEAQGNGSLPDEPISNCAVNSKAQKNQALSQSSKLLSKKVFIEPLSISSDSGLRTKGQVSMVEEGAELVALIDNNCKDNDKTYWSQELAGANQQVRKLRSQAYGYRIKQNTSLAEFTGEINQDPCVIAVERNMKLKMSAIPNDTNFSMQEFHGDLRSSPAWDIFYDTNTGIDPNLEIVVAVVDTGIDYNHEDLSANMWDDGNGNVGIDLVNADTDPLDDQGHGTHVSGLVAAAGNNAKGVSGVMGSQAKLMAVKVLDADGNGSLQNIVNGILFAAQNKADIINLSLGGEGFSVALQDALLTAVEQGSLVLVAAGNDGKEITNQFFIAPAGYAKDIDGVVSVGATTSNTRTLANFSNFSDTYVEIASPGTGGILSTLPNNAYGFASGTSMATPIVSGAAALMKALFKSRGYNFSPALLEAALLRGSATDNRLVGGVIGNKHLDLLNLAQFVDGHNDQEIMITRQPAGKIVAINSAVSLGVEFNEDFALSFQWQKNGTDIQGATESTLSIQSVQESDSGTYQLVVTHGGGLRIFKSNMAKIGVLPACVGSI